MEANGGNDVATGDVSDATCTSSLTINASVVVASDALWDIPEPLMPMSASSILTSGST